FILVGLFFIIVFLPAMRLNQKTARLTDGNYARAQSAMRDLILTGDDRTVDRLYEIASSAAAPMESRLRAVDALAVMREAAADRALLRLEIAGRTDELIRHAAINARRQRRASARGSRDD
ncbi:MAG: hypothetical protein LBJ46_10715, partial [Planctomycetota bacterium]|nr:hypothetical protein [Planctomycetota bacterium]